MLADKPVLIVFQNSIKRLTIDVSDFLLEYS